MKDPRLLFTKDELPTWNEFYQFILKGNFVFDSEIDTKIDPYWKYPSQLMRLAWCCNQLNKFLFERNEGNVSFWLIDNVTIDFMPKYFAKCEEKNKDFPNVRFLIYHCKNPTTGKYSEFITNDSYRYDIEGFYYKEKFNIKLGMFFHPSEERIHYNIPFHKYIRYSEDTDFIRVINDLTSEVKSYYEDPIGWKS